MKLAQRIALWADKLRDVSAMGLHFARTPYDEEHYRQVQDVAIEMLALAVDESVEKLAPLRATVYAQPTPLAVGDGAVIDRAGRLLLVRRADNGKWAMPGGALEVGETPAEGVVREVLEETGVHCRPVALVGVFDSRRCGTESRHHLYHFVFLCEPVGKDPIASPSHEFEVLETGWFEERALPAEIDPGHISRIPEAFRVWRGGSAYFDR
ncbi:MAG TPA: NUDIX domain-containing protein [Chloroflexi bacterium]|nr:NUDIX domain-containing protein [Chloroflexota bacterium]